MILAIDQGTTGTTCFVFDEQLRADRTRAPRVRPALPPARLGRARRGRDLVGHAGRRRRGARRRRGSRPGDLAAVGIANQRETVCVWDPRTGEPLHNAIVWQDRRTAARCEELRAAGHEPLIRERTGLVLDPYFSATKIAWLLEHVDGLRERAHDGTAVFGTIDSWLIFKLTGRAPHRRHQRLAHAALRHRRRALGPGAARAVRRPRPRAARGAAERRGLRRDAPDGAPRPRRPDRRRRRRPAGRAVRPGLRRSRAWPRPPTAPARSCCSTPASRCPSPGRACSRRSPRRWTSRSLQPRDLPPRLPTRWRRRSSSPAPPCSGCATSCRSSSAPRTPRRWRRRWIPTTASTSCRRSPASARRTGIPTRAARSSGSRAGPVARIWRARRSRRSPIRRSTRSARWRPPRAGRSSELRADGGASANGWLMQFQADVLGVPVVLGESTETTALGAAYLAGVGVGLWTVVRRARLLARARAL